MAYAAKKEDNKVSEIDFVVPDSSALDVTSGRYTQIEEVRKVKNRLADLKGFEKKMESDILAVYYSDETKGIRILNKETGKSIQIYKDLMMNNEEPIKLIVLIAN